jgi:GNAT superfamily N-acetyltransferase
MQFRHATLLDAEDVTSLMKSVSGVWQNTWRADAVSRCIEASSGLSVIAIDDCRLIGFAGVHDLGFRAYLSEFVIDEAYQHRGIGTQLLRFAKEELARRGCRLIIADAYPPAASFYTERGWCAPRSTLLCHDL